MENDVHIEINFDGGIKKEFCFCLSVYKIKFVSQFTKKKLIFWYHVFPSRWEELKNEISIVFLESRYINSYREFMILEVYPFRTQCGYKKLLEEV